MGQERMIEMKTGILLGVIGCSLVAGWFAYPDCAAGNHREGNPQQVPALSQTEINDLLFMREEEKLAHDVYVTLYSEWGRRVFDKISQSERRHTDAVLGLLDAYGLRDPALGFGMFSNDQLQSLYDTLAVRGAGSELAALYAGALIEEVDMEDLVPAMDRTDHTDILNVYSNLLAGSRKHLIAFVRNIEGLTGEAYVAQRLEQGEVDAILGR